MKPEEGLRTWVVSLLCWSGSDGRSCSRTVDADARECLTLWFKTELNIRGDADARISGKTRHYRRVFRSVFL
jgi:hypothetical protein